MAKCSECGALLVNCDQRGNPAGTGWLVCPEAAAEQTPEEFGRPYHPRRHHNAHIMPTPETRKRQHAAAASQQLPMFAGI